MCKITKTSVLYPPLHLLFLHSFGRFNFIPAFSLTAFAGTNSFRFNNWFDLPGSLVKNIAANMTQPIFRKKALKTAYEIAALEQEKSVTQFGQTVMVAVGEVSDALAAIRQTEKRLLLVEQKNQSLTKASNDAVLLYKSAMANYLEVITAQSNALQNELDAISIKKEKLIAVTNLYRALGGGAED
ncbi:TolC family protein [Parapedobacter deserti]|uniref:TolC family protein n=1 Tax=Parapedobacter deserti TaxID=1912957 RepID=A0ABV7JNN7_9SPHI